MNVVAPNVREFAPVAEKIALWLRARLPEASDVSVSRCHRRSRNSPASSRNRSKLAPPHETGPRLIMFTHLSIKRRYSEADKMDVELTATAFERLKDDKSKKKPDNKTDGKDK